LKEINHKIFASVDELYNTVAMHPPAVAFEKKLQKEGTGGPLQIDNRMQSVSGFI